MKQSEQNSVKSENTILPLGSVVKTRRDPGTLLVIIARAPLTVMHGTTGYFDYGAVQFPYGMTDPAKIIFFNRQDVTEIVFMDISTPRNDPMNKGLMKSPNQPPTPTFISDSVTGHIGHTR